MPFQPGTSSLLVVPAVMTTRADVTPRRDPDLPFRDQRNDTTPREIPLSLKDGPGGADVTIDLGRIRERRNDLFPFVTWDLGFLRERPWRDRSTPLEYQPDEGVVTPPGAPLQLSSEQIQRIVDRAWSRRHRWLNLHEIVEFAGRYSGDRGDLPAVLREYVQQNIPQPYEDWTDADPVFWITLMLAADDAPLVEFVARYLRRNPANRVATELLFLLDASAESSCDVLLRVLRAGTPDLPLTVTRLDNPEAFELAVSLASAYRGWVWRHRVDVLERCTSGRIAILRRIIDTAPDGYGASDARFRLGQLLWTAGRRDEAIDWWTGMQPDERHQHAAAQKALTGAIEDGAPEFNPGRISNILIDEEQRWRAAAGARLEQFGLLATEF
jgi:hypothetical protein